MKAKDQTIRKAGPILGNFLLVLLFLVGLALFVSILPIKGNFRILSVTSGSMEPTIHTGSLIVVRPVDEYKPGDIITFRSTDSSEEKSNTTHRIISMQEPDGFKEYETKGDANEVADTDKVKPSRIIGKHLFSVRYLGYALMYIKTVPGLLILIIMPATIIIYEEIKKIRQEFKQMALIKLQEPEEKVKQKKKRKKLSKDNNGKKG